MQKPLNFIALLAIFILQPMASWASDPDISKLYAEANVNGTLIIASLDGNKLYLHNPQRAQQAFLPASTFKIPNTLIALNEGIVQHDKTPIKWDGIKRDLAVWNQDQTLHTAFTYSCVWCYQQFAANIGQQKYQHYIKQLHYGNEKTGSELTTFWLEGDLRISTLGQVRFLRKLYNKDLPFKHEHFTLLKKIMLVEKTPDYTLYAKTGWATRTTPSHGWYVGYIETKTNTWLFANNIQIDSSAELPLRKQLVMAALKKKGIIPY